MRGTSSRLKLFYTSMPDDQADLVMRMDRYRANEKGADIPVILSVIAYVSNDKLASDSDLFLDVSPMAYEVPSDREVTFGETPAGGIAGFGEGGDFWAFLAESMGPLGERLYDRMFASQARVFDANGTLVAEGQAGVIEEGVLARTRHRFEVTAESSLFTASIDLAQNDTLLLKFTGLRIVDEHGRQLSIVDRQSRPALLFSVADEINEDIWRWRVPPRESETFAEYRPHGTMEWRPLPAV
ncbi:MAG TPA: hypothetical protein VE974_04890 [Thermoanaerobaculia bacterium]|nr:hypothetical protein [Thermoanaerobaculia bacterium]